MFGHDRNPTWLLHPSSVLCFPLMSEFPLFSCGLEAAAVLTLQPSLFDQSIDQNYQEDSKISGLRVPITCSSAQSDGIVGKKKKKKLHISLSRLWTNNKQHLRSLCN